jgi:hypothetical protein
MNKLMVWRSNSQVITTAVAAQSQQPQGRSLRQTSICCLTPTLS